MSYYSVEELALKDDSEEEQIRTRKIFEDLKLRGLRGEKLLEREKEFLCTLLKLTLYKDDGRPEDFSICNDFIFRELYLTYFHNDLAGPFYKAKRGKVVEVEDKEKFKDLKTLQVISDKWQKELAIENHKDQIYKNYQRKQEKI